MSRWFVEGDVIDGLKEDDEERMLNCVQNGFNESEDIEVKRGMLEM